METLLLHPHTRQMAANFLAHPTHALLLVAPEGSGKLILSQHLAAGLLGTTADKIAKHPGVRAVLPEKDKTSISIDAVRDLQQFTKLKLAKRDARRVIVIPDAETMTAEAQNALLKLLEEPPANTFFILTTSREQRLLATVRSRVQALELRRPDRAATEQYFATQGFSAKNVRQAYLMSGGLTGLMHALLTNADHPLLASVQTARELLKATQFERLCKVDELAKQKDETQQVMIVLRQMAAAAIDQTADIAVIRRWRSVLGASYDAEDALLQNASAKLTLTHFMLVL